MGCSILSFQRSKLAVGKRISYTQVDLLSMGSNDSWRCIWTKSACAFDGALLIISALNLSSPIRSVYHLVSESMIPWLIIAKIVAIHAFLTTLQFGLFGYRLRAVKQVSVLIYWPIMRLMYMIITLIVRPLVINVLLSWSTRWKEYNTQSFKDLRRVVNRSIDPLYPSGEQPVASSSKDVQTVLSSSSSFSFFW